MALAEELPIFHDGYILLEHVVDVEKDMPRMLRYALGEKMLDLCLDLLGGIYEANMTADATAEKYRLIMKVIISYRKLEILMRLVFHQKVISTGRYAEIVKVMERIGRQATGWKNKNQVQP
ncbi:MAG TPA: four helix bundle protein [Prevotella sp.]|jgi:hypothetical protein|nr:four helix bundle protein [Prevotella sp.]